MRSKKLFSRQNTRERYLTADTWATWTNGPSIRAKLDEDLISLALDSRNCFVDNNPKIKLIAKAFLFHLSP
jgi:hypothetical protein